MVVNWEQKQERREGASISGCEDGVVKTSAVECQMLEIVNWAGQPR